MCAEVQHAGDKDHHQGDDDRVSKTHHWSEWRQSEPWDDMLHFSDKNRVNMGKQVVKFFVGEQERFGNITNRLTNYFLSQSYMGALSNKHFFSGNVYRRFVLTFSRTARLFPPFLF